MWYVASFACSFDMQYFGPHVARDRQLFVWPFCCVLPSHAIGFRDRLSHNQFISSHAEVGHEDLVYNNRGTGCALWMVWLVFAGEAACTACWAKIWSKVM